jgi:N-acetylglucosamine-6-phosphate deacetylase
VSDTAGAGSVDGSTSVWCEWAVSDTGVTGVGGGLRLRPSRRGCFGRYRSARMDAIDGRIITPDGVVRGRVVLDGEVVAGIVPDSTAPDRWVCPGFIDLQLNGTHGVDLWTEPHRLDDVAVHLPDEGVTAFLATVITGPAVVRDAAIDAMAAHTDRPGNAAVLGLHLEGPVLSPDAHGAHPVEHLLMPSACDTARWTREHGVRLVTLAPELPGARELIAQLAGAGVVVALGHSDATAEEFTAGFDAGASMCTHLFNAMRGFYHREPGPVGAVLGNPDRWAAVAGLICDGEHVHPAAVTMTWRVLGPIGIALVTDAVAARGVRDEPPRTAGGSLAGSVLRLDDAVRNLVAWTGASLPDAIATVTSTPARVLGIGDRGVLEPGACADVVVLDDRLEIAQVVVRGTRVR